MLWRCLWGRGQRGNSVACLLVCGALFNELSCETGSISHCGNPGHSPQSALSLSFPLKSAPPAPPHHSQGLSPHCSFSESACAFRLLTDLVVLVDFFFNSLVVRVPYSLIFWRFWLFIDFRLVVILLLVVRGSEGFLPVPPSWPELPHCDIVFLI